MPHSGGGVVVIVVVDSISTTRSLQPHNFLPWRFVVRTSVPIATFHAGVGVSIPIPIPTILCHHMVVAVAVAAAVAAGVIVVVGYRLSLRKCMRTVCLRAFVFLRTLEVKIQRVHHGLVHCRHLRLAHYGRLVPTIVVVVVLVPVGRR